MSIVVADGNDAERQANQTWREVEHLRKEIALRDDQLDKLRAEIEELRRELRAVHRRTFQKHRHPDEGQDEGEETSAGGSVSSPAAADTEKPKKKRRAPVGHPGWFRAIPTVLDRTQEVVPATCPHCGGAVQVDPAGLVHNHGQEDGVDGRVERVSVGWPHCR